jgi:large subunit ribosomal protein L17
MRHRLKGSKLGRTASHRKATLRALSIALITHHRVVTTLSKAKELRRHIEPVITRAKEDTMHNRREVFSFIHDNDAVSKLFNEVGPKVADRPGGYTRVIKIGYRTGDSADMAVIELVDYNTTGGEETGKKKKRTRRAGSGKVVSKDVAAVKEVPAKVEEVKSEGAVAEAEVVETTEVEEKTATEPTAEVPETTEETSGEEAKK